MVNQLSLIASVQQHPRTLSLRLIEAKIAALGIAGCTNAAYKILVENATGGEGEWGYTTNMHKAMHTYLSPGPPLSAMCAVMVSSLTKELCQLNHQGGNSVSLFNWITHIVTIATTNSEYGEFNPFKDPKARIHFWTFEPRIVSLLVGVLPSMTARKAYLAREAMVALFQDYFNTHRYEQGSDFIKARFDLGIKHGLSKEDLSRLEITTTVAILSNTVPTAFWMIYHIFSDPEVLADCRHEVLEVMSSRDRCFPRDLANIRICCPILHSVLQETLRFHNIGVSARIVMKDHILDNKFYLREGNALVMPTRVQHFDTSLWGEDANYFVYRRFIDRKSRIGAFRGFGGGNTLCPGRHFASVQVLTFAAMLVSQFDIMPCSGKWVLPSTHGAAIWAAMPKPDYDLTVDIYRNTDHGKRFVSELFFE